MIIKISYMLHTDGDYALRNPEKFGCTAQKVEIKNDYFDYIGSVSFHNDEIWRCKSDAKSFLEQFLCDGISVSSTHYWLIKSFYDIIEDLMDFINKNDSGMRYGTISGNQDGTKIMVEISKDEN